MLELKEYVAIQDFTLSLDNGKTPTYVKRGEPLKFDGLNVEVHGETGTARPLAKVIGEWISLIGVKVVPVKKQLASVSRNATGGRVVEHSDYPSDPMVGVKNPPSDSVTALLKSYEVAPEVKIVNGKREVTSDMDDIRKEITIINDDANEVRKVSANDGAPITNKSGVEMGKDKGTRGVVMTPDGDVVKATNYSGKKASIPERKKLTIDYESSGVEVQKISANKPKVANTPIKMETFATDDVVAETSYPAVQTTDVGSSTQAQVEQRKTVKKSATKKKSTAKKSTAKKSTAKKSTAKKAPVRPGIEASDAVEDLIADAPVESHTRPTVAKGPKIVADGQEAYVISKVTRDKQSSVHTENGITSRVTIGASEDMDVGEVTFSSNNDFDTEPEVTFGAGEDTPYDPTEADVFGADEAQIIDAEDNIDLNDLLSEV
jgi:hypothetical protein